ncbi:MAG: type II toxin-antitoxin system RelE/ParE family toxin [Anaerolineae bacterium]|nr:type II toxin-antitoxin system RelE/ParE family toxin [Anaerolineae bacterium]
MYEPAFHPDVAKDLKGLDRSIRQRVLDKIQWLLEHIEETQHKPLTAQWEGMYRVRVGDYRVIYEIDRKHRRIIIYAVGHRREIYKLHRAT